MFLRNATRFALGSVCLLLGACATDALDQAPPHPDSPWNPPTDASGAIVPGAASREHGDNRYVLPADPSLAQVTSRVSLDPRHAYTLAELIDQAQSGNPDSRSAWDAARDAALAAGIARASYLPLLSASVIGGYQTGHGRSSVDGAQLSSDSSLGGSLSAVSLQWLLFDFGQRQQLVNAANQTSVAANVAFTAVHQQIIYQVSLAFYALAAAQARAATADAGVQNAQTVVQAAAERRNRGFGTVTEVAQARQALASAQLMRIQAQAGEQDARLALLGAVGASPLASLQITAPAGRPLTSALDAPVEQIVTSALARRPDMLAAAAVRKASLAGVRAAEAEFMPKLFLSASGAYTTSGLDVTSIPGIGQQPATVNLGGEQLNGTVLLGLSIPLYNGGARHALLEQARDKADSAQATLDKVRDEATREIVKAANAVKTSLAAYQAAQALSQAAQTTFDAALAAYQNGVGTISASAEAQSALLQARNAVSDAYNNSLAAAASLAFASGTLGAAPAAP